MAILAMAVVCLAVQDPTEEWTRGVEKALERAHRGFRISLVQLGPDAIPELEKRLEGPSKEIVKQAIEEIRRLKEPIEKLMAQLASEDFAVRDQATGELAKIGRSARPYLEKSRKHEQAEVRARVEALLRRFERPVRSELETLRDREREEIQNLRVRARMEAEVERGSKTTLDLVRLRIDLERYRFLNGSMALATYLKSIRNLFAEELGLEEKRFATGTATALDVLRARIQLLHTDRRMGKDVSGEITKAIRDASDHLLLQTQSGLVKERDALEQLLKLSTDRDEDLD